MRTDVRAVRLTTGGGFQPQSGVRAMVPRILLLVLAVFITLHALAIYPLLDARLAMGVLLSLFILSAASMTISFIQQQGNDGGPWLRLAFLVSWFVLAAFGILLLVNGGLDRSPSNEVSATVLQKAIIKGRYGAVQYQLFVSSWRPGVSREDLSVISSVYDRAAIGKPVTVKLHEGYFGLPWYGSILPE